MFVLSHSVSNIVSVRHSISVLLTWSSKEIQWHGWKTFLNFHPLTVPACDHSYENTLSSIDIALALANWFLPQGASSSRLWKIKWCMMGSSMCGDRQTRHRQSHPSEAAEEGDLISQDASSPNLCRPCPLIRKHGKMSCIVVIINWCLSVWIIWPVSGTARHCHLDVWM